MSKTFHITLSFNNKTNNRFNSTDNNSYIIGYLLKEIGSTKIELGINETNVPELENVPAINFDDENDSFKYGDLFIDLVK